MSHKCGDDSLEMESDVNPLFQALIDSAGDYATNPGCGCFCADVIHDGVVDALDIGE